MKDDPRIWVLEDAKVTRERIGVSLAREFPHASVRYFTSRLELEAAWQDQNGGRPDAMIADLLVPERYPWMASVLFRRPGGVCGILYGVMRPLVRILASYRIAQYSSMVEASPETLYKDWGGLGFLLERTRKNDWRGVRFYIYSFVTDSEFLLRSVRLQRICSLIVATVREKLEGKLCPSIFTKGHPPITSWGAVLYGADPVGDELPRLMQQMRQDLCVT